MYEVSSFQEVGIRGVPLYTEVSSFQGVGIEEFHCNQEIYFDAHTVHIFISESLMRTGVPLCRCSYQFLIYVFFFFNVIFAAVMSFLRVFASLMFTIVMYVRLDWDVYMRGLEGWDFGELVVMVNGVLVSWLSWGMGFGELVAMETRGMGVGCHGD